MFTHSSTSGFSLYLMQQDSPWFPLYLIVPFWVKTAVPIFFMISGALLLGKDEPIPVLFRKRIWRFLQVIFVFSLINYIYFYAVPEHHFSVSRFLTLTYASNMATAYYFLYIYVAFLLMLPLWRAMVRSMTNSLYLYLIGLNLFFVGCIPVFSFLLFKGSAEMNGFLNPLLAVSEPSFYFIIGYWIEHVLPESWINKKNLIRLGAAAALGTVIAAFMTWYHGCAAGALTERGYIVDPEAFYRVPWLCRRRADRADLSAVLRLLPFPEHGVPFLSLPLVVPPSQRLSESGKNTDPLRRSFLWDHAF